MNQFQLLLSASQLDFYSRNTTLILAGVFEQRFCRDHPQPRLCIRRTLFAVLAQSRLSAMHSCKFKIKFETKDLQVSTAKSINEMLLLQTVKTLKLKLFSFIVSIHSSITLNKVSKFQEVVKFKVLSWTFFCFYYTSSTL